MIPPLHTHSLVPDISLGVVRLQEHLTYVLFWRGERRLAMLGAKHLKLDYMVHIHSVMITYGVCLYSICIAVGVCENGSESLCR